MNQVKEFFNRISGKVYKFFSRRKKPNIEQNTINFNLHRASSSSVSIRQASYSDFRQSDLLESGQNSSAGAYIVTRQSIGKQKYFEFLDKVQKIEDKNIAEKSGELIFNGFQIKNIKNKVNNSLAKTAVSYDANKIISILLKNFRDSEDFVDYIEKKFSNNKYRFAKNNDQERTAVIAFGADGEMTLVGMHNRKHAGDRVGQKSNSNAFRGKGTFKKVKNSYDLTNYSDNKTEDAVLARASIVLPYNTLASVLELEILFSTFTGANNIVIPKAISAPFVRNKKGTSKTKEVVLYVFYDAAECTLEELFNDEQKRIELLGNTENELYKEMLYNHGPVPETVKRILLQIAEGIKEIHDQGYVHQDIKPQNILIFKKKIDGERSEIYAKITDFGLAVYANNRNNRAHSTAFVAAPEIFSAYSDEDKLDHSYYFNPDYSCYGRYIYQNTPHFPQKLFVRSTMKTDIWAFELYAI